MKQNLEKISIKREITTYIIYVHISAIVLYRNASGFYQNSIGLNTQHGVKYIIREVLSVNKATLQKIVASLFLRLHCNE